MNEKMLALVNYSSEPHQLTEGMTKEQIEKFLDGMMELMRKKPNGS